MTVTNLPPVEAVKLEERAERIERLRHTLLSVGWREVMAPTLAQHMEVAKNNLAVAPHERQPPYDKWTEERIGGYIIGLGYALNNWLPEIRRHDAMRALAVAEERSALAADHANGHPYAPEDHTEAAP